MKYYLIHYKPSFDETNAQEPEAWLNEDGGFHESRDGAQLHTYDEAEAILLVIREEEFENPSCDGTFEMISLDSLSLTKVE